MLKRLHIQGFKTLADVEVRLPRLAVLFGPNAAGKSNFLDAIQALSRLSYHRTIADALGEPIRGYPVELFTFPPGGLPELLSRSHARFTLEADVETSRGEEYRYRVSIQIEPRSGKLSLADEFLTRLTRRNQRPAFEAIDGRLHIRRKRKPAHPRVEPLGVNHTYLSDPRLGGDEYRWIEAVREELSDWRTYYLDPRVAMRAPQPPADVTDIGVLGELIAPFLYKLRAEQPKHFLSLQRTLRSLIPSVDDLRVDLDTRRATLDLSLQQGGVDYSSRVISEGTLRVLALCAIVANPWAGSLIAFEEPENGVHPRRLELVAELLTALALHQRRQVILTTHSPEFCAAIFRRAREQPEDIALLRVRRDDHRSRVERVQPTGALFDDAEIAEALTSPTEDGVFYNLLLMGALDE